MALHPVSEMLSRSEELCVKAKNERQPMVIVKALSIQHALLMALVQANGLRDAQFDSETGVLEL